MVKALRSVQVDPVLPEPLKPLQEIASNLWWCWNQEAIQLFSRIDTKAWETSGHNPTRVLGLITQEKLQHLSQDRAFLEHLQRVHAELREYLKKDTWFNQKHFKKGDPEIAYFSAEFGLAEGLPIYSGGLGVLAGDHLKSACDLGLPLVGVGLLYQRGYFQQYLNADGWQQEYFPELDFSTLPLTEMRDQEGNPLLVELGFPGRKVFTKIWKLTVGRIELYLLDANITQNAPDDREITSKLYGGDNEMRIKQEIVLGIGGVRALQKLNLTPAVYHMNEGHSAFSALERIIRRMREDKISFWEASILVRQTTVFTTHTPVPAGIDRFPRSLIEKYFKGYVGDLGININDFFRLGSADNSTGATDFNMAHLAMNFSSYINGVSKLHAAVSRSMWQKSWADVPIDEIPIKPITNGVHASSWISPEMKYLFNRYLIREWRENLCDKKMWAEVGDIPDGELWRTHEIRRERMISHLRKHLARQFKRRGMVQSEITRARELLNSDFLTIGFARRFATYKRGTLIFKDLERLKQILNNPKYPVQLIFAGKAHPRDNHGKELIKTIVHLARDPHLRDRIVFLENYDMSLARYLVQGVDVWLNTPRRPMEASGTSGMKVIFNGGLNLSVLDGWWPEGFTPDTGWAIGGGEDYDDHDYQDSVEANALYDVLEKEIVPLYYDRGPDGIPRSWTAKMKQSIKTLAPLFNSDRMVQEYTDDFYMQAYRQSQILRHRDFEELRSLANWYKQLNDRWHDVRILDVTSNAPERIGVSQSFEISSTVHLGALKPDDVEVQLYVGKLAPTGDITEAQAITMHPAGECQDGTCQYNCTTSSETSGRLGYSVRVLPGHRSIVHPFELRLITWADGQL